MGALLPFGQPVIITHPYLRHEIVWITSAKPSFFVGGDWQYEVRTDKRLKKSEYFLWGGDWFDEMDLKTITGAGMGLPSSLNIPIPDMWPPRITRVLGRRIGIWGANGLNPNPKLMYSFLPGAITCIEDYLSHNKVFEYKKEHPEIPVIVRFLHPPEWRKNPTKAANELAAKVIKKWPALREIDPYIYVANEINLDYENNDAGNQAWYETEEFYKQFGAWVNTTAQIIKNKYPEIKLVTPPFAYGHEEDGQPDDEGNPKIGWAGYDYLADTIRDYFDNIICFHAYWGDSSGYIEDRLYHPEISTWHAFRWRRVLKLFKKRYDIDARLIIDECGNFESGHPEFFDQLKYFAGECLGDERVIAVTPFLWHDPTNSPGNLLNSWTQNIPNIEVFVSKLKALPDATIEGNEPEPPPEPEPEPQPDPEPDPDPEPPPGPAQNVKMIVEHGKGLPLIVGNWFEPGQPVELELPWGTVNKTITGAKAADYGPGGFEAGYAAGPGVYKLRIGSYAFELDMPDPPVYTRLSFEQTGPPVELQARLVSSVMTAGLAEELVAKLETEYPGVFEVEVV